VPRALRRLLNRLRYRRFDAEIAEELAFHRSLKASEHRTDGESAGPAAVSRAMGNELRMREIAREVWIPQAFEALRQDLRDAFRMIVRRPLFTSAAVAALILGVGGATTAFSLLNALVLRRLPVERPDELVYLRDPSFSYPILQEIRSRTSLLAGSFAWNLDQYDVMWGVEPEPTLVLLASGTLHATLGVRPVAGRLLTADDEGASASDAAAIGVLSYGAWQRRFAADPGVLGRTISIQGVPITIVGVTPPEFFGVAPGRSPEITVPVTLAERLRPAEGDTLTQPGRAWLHFMGRLRRDISLMEADAELQTIWPHVLEITTSTSETPQRRARYLSRRTAFMEGATGYSSVRNQFRQPLLILSGLSALLLLLGCATVANLLLAGAWGRSRELAVRLALGCSRGRLARQLLLEGLILASLAGVASVVISRWSAEALVALLTTAQEPVMLDLWVDARVVGFLVAIVALSAVAFNAAPIVMTLHVEPGSALKSGSRQVAAQGDLAGRALVAVQIALSVVLLFGAALFLRSLGHLLSLDPGFDSRRLLVARVEPAAGSLPDDEARRGQSLAAFYRAITDAIGATREVESVALSLYPPVSDEDGSWTRTVGVDGAAPVESGTATYFNAVSPGYFATLGTPLVAGRDFTSSDRLGSQPVVVVNAALARRFFAGENPIGRRITVGLSASRQNLTIVGVVADSKYQRLQEETRDIAYLPYLQSPETLNGRAMSASIRVVRVSDRVQAAVRESLAGVDAQLRPRVDRLDNRIQDSLVIERLLAVLGIALAGVALFLAGGGLFGLMAHLVARRTREIGVRLALGARPSKVLTRVLGESLGLTLVGLVAGIASAAGAARWVGAMLHGVTVSDPIAYLGVVIVTLGLALAAGLVPALRAAAVDPIEALRAE
jgi:putative ABC transport system permease protein